MNDDMDLYIGRCLKNWTARYRPPLDVRKRVVMDAGHPPLEDPVPFSRFFSAFANRWSSPCEQLYAQRHWQLAGPLNQSLTCSFHLVIQQKLAQ